MRKNPLVDTSSSAGLPPRRVTVICSCVGDGEVARHGDIGNDRGGGIIPGIRMSGTSVLGAVGFVASSVLCLHYKKQRLREIHSSVQLFLDSWVYGGSLPNAQLVIYKGEKEIFHGVSGYADVGKKVTLNRDSIYRVYSMTKPVTVVAVLILVERGLVSLDDPVGKYIPSFSNMTVFISGDASNPITEPVHRAVTVLDLMTHTSGLSYGIFGAGPVDEIIQNRVGADWKNWFRSTLLKDLCDILGTCPLSFQPGTKVYPGHRHAMPLL